VDRQKDVVMHTRMQRSILAIRIGPIADTYHNLQDRNQVIRQRKGWRGRRRGCWYGQEGFRYSDKIRRPGGTWR